MNKINELLLLKKNSENLVLDDEVLIYFNKLFNNNLSPTKQQVNKFKTNKNSISNKINLILNKLSDNNIDNLLIEFIENIGFVEINDYQIILLI